MTDPPHDHPDQPAADHLPRGPGAEILDELMDQATPILANHPVNQARVAAGKPPASAIWLWGQGKAPAMPKFAELHHLKGAIISAVDLVRGVGVLAGWTRIDVPGATGYLDTDYAAKGAYGIEALENYDIVCVHVEAPDEASHEGRHDAKVEALERIDRDIVGPIRNALATYDQWRILISPDHSTLLRTRAHDRAPVAWVMAGTGLPASRTDLRRAGRQGCARALFRPGISPDGAVPRPELGRARMTCHGLIRIHLLHLFICIFGAVTRVVASSEIWRHQRRGFRTRSWRRHGGRFRLTSAAIRFWSSCRPAATPPTN